MTPERRAIITETRKKVPENNGDLYTPRSGNLLETLDDLKKSGMEFEISPTLHRIDKKREVLKDIERREKRTERLKQYGYPSTERELGDPQIRYKFKSKIGLFGLFCIITVSIYIIYVSTTLLYDLISEEFIVFDFIYFVILVIIGIGAFLGGLRMARNIILVEYIFDDTFENAIYPRLEPALKEVAKVQVEIDELKVQMERMNLNISRNRKFPPVTDNPLKLLESSIYNFLRYVFLINLSLAIIVFIIIYPSSIMPYILTLLYPIWWMAITAEYKLWKVDEVWAWVFLPILIVPGAVFLFDGVIEHGMLVGLIATGLVAFAFSYRTWAKYYVEGTFILTDQK